MKFLFEINWLTEINKFQVNETLVCHLLQYKEVPVKCIQYWGTLSFILIWPVTSSGSEELLFGTQSFASPQKASSVPLTPDRTDQPEGTGEGDSHSSYGGSCHSDSELSGICESDEERYVCIHRSLWLSFI